MVQVIIPRGIICTDFFFKSLNQPAKLSCNTSEKECRFIFKYIRCTDNYGCSIKSSLIFLKSFYFTSTRNRNKFWLCKRVNSIHKNKTRIQIMFTRLGNVFQNHKLRNIKYMKDEARHDSKRKCRKSLQKRVVER